MFNVYSQHKLYFFVLNLKLIFTSFKMYERYQSLVARNFETEDAEARFADKAKFSIQGLDRQLFSLILLSIAGL